MQDLKRPTQVPSRTVNGDQSNALKPAKPRLLERLDCPAPGLWHAQVLARTSDNQSARRITLLVTIVTDHETKTIGWTCRPNIRSHHAVDVPVGTKSVLIRHLQSESSNLTNVEFSWLGFGFLARLRVTLAEKFKLGLQAKSYKKFKVVQAIEAANAQLDHLEFGEVGFDSLSILMPSRDQPDLLLALFDKCFKLILQNGGEVIIIDHASILPKTAETLQYLEAAGCIVARADGAFNYSRLINQAAKLATRPRYLILNDDVSPLNEQDFIRLGGLDCLKMRAIIAPLLVYPEANHSGLTVQHAGAFLGMGGLCGHWLRHLPLVAEEVVAWRKTPRRVDALTGAAMLVGSSIFNQLCGFDEKYQVECSDIDFCLRASRQGWSSILVSDCVWVHPESVSRGRGDTSPHSRSIWRDRRRFWLQWRYELGTLSHLPEEIDGMTEAPQLLVG